MKQNIRLLNSLFKNWYSMSTLEKVQKLNVDLSCAKNDLMWGSEELTKTVYYLRQIKEDECQAGCLKEKENALETAIKVVEWIKADL